MSIIEEIKDRDKRGVGKKHGKKEESSDYI